MEKQKQFEAGSEISNSEQERADAVVEEYLTEKGDSFTEIIDPDDVDKVLARLIEKGPELDPMVRASLRKAVRRALGL